MLAKRYGDTGEACTRGRFRSEQVSQWLRKRNGEEGLTAARFAFSTTKVCVSPGSLIRPNHSSALLALSLSYPLCQALKQWPHQILKGGRRLLCANLADPAPAGAARGYDPTAAPPGLSTRHGPLRAAPGRGLVVAAAPGLLAGHGPLRATRNRGPATAAGLWWTCSPDSSAGGQRQTTCSWRWRSQQPQR